MSLTLVVGNKNYSSWSFRPWLHMKHAGLDFREHVIPLYRPGHVEDIKAFSRAGRVPVLLDGDLHIWDSLAICEYIAEKTGFGWPKLPAARAHARSVSAEMHSGFQSLRSQCPMNIRARRHVPMTAELARDVARIEELWSDCRERHGAGGPWLFGTFSIADAMYAPVVTRLRTYGMDLSAVSAAYMQTALADRHFAEWVRAAAAEPWKVEETDVVGTPA